MSSKRQSAYLAFVGLQAKEGRGRGKPEVFEAARFSRAVIQMLPSLPQTVKLFTVNFNWKIPNGARCCGCLQSYRGSDEVSGKWHFRDGSA